MGIDSLWPRILRSEGDTYVEKGDPSDVKTIFVDGQVMLMKSTMPTHVTTWEQFVSFNFSSKIQRLHRSYEIVILSFDNYQVSLHLLAMACFPVRCSGWCIDTDFPLNLLMSHLERH